MSRMCRTAEAQPESAKAHVLVILVSCDDGMPREFFHVVQVFP